MCVKGKKGKTKMESKMAGKFKFQAGPFCRCSEENVSALCRIHCGGDLCPEVREPSEDEVRGREWAAGPHPLLRAPEKRESVGKLGWPDEIKGHVSS